MNLPRRIVLVGLGLTALLPAGVAAAEPAAPAQGAVATAEKPLTMNIEAKLTELGLKLPNPPAVAGSYVPWVRTGNLLYLAGTISSFNGEMTHVGQVGKDQTVPAGYESAKICALNTLANIKAATGSLDSVKQFVLVTGFVNAVSGFSDSPAVINGASELFGKLYGDAGKHARAAVAAAGLPKNSTVEIQVIVELK